MKTKIKKVLICSAQIAIIAFMRLVFFGRVKVSIDDKATKIKGPIVIAANHISGLDPFILGCFVPIRSYFKFFPYSFMTANIFYYSLIKPLYWLAGCYPAKPKTESTPQLRYGIHYAIKSFQEGYSIVMFPEGKRTKKQIEAKRGISMILEGTRSELLICYIKWGSVGPFKTVKLTFKLAAKSIDKSNPDEIMTAIYSMRDANNLVSARQAAI